ncbi:intradiol ring-cleavage dioxygenase [Shinella sp.]|uniref:dioxygenase family protein n=1 Tax=Shinella sp. TaxID=1870904 RepID=UPI003F70F973
MSFSRRDILASFTVASGLSLMRLPKAHAQQALLDPAPVCGVDHEPTPRSAEGPFFSLASPERSDITEGRAEGPPLMVGGFVLDRDCKPIARALVELWQANGSGLYDNRGYLLRGHQFSGADGRWGFATVVPGPYGDRCRHIHVKVQRAGGGVLTSQLFFPDDPLHARDSLYDPRLLLQIGQDGSRALGRYDFILA